MVKTPQSLLVRLSDILNHVLRLSALYGYVKTSDVIDATGLTDRIVRDYLNYLVDLGVLEYAGSGVYHVNKSRVAEVLAFLEPEPYTQLKITHFIDQKLLNEWRSTRELTGKISRVLEKLNFGLLFADGELKEEIRRLVPGFSGNVVGDRFILENAANRILLDDVMVPGSSAAYHLHNYGYGDFVILTNIYISSAIYGAYYSGDQIDGSKSVERVIPDFKDFWGREPFEVGDPFYEISTDLPDLLGFARNIAARYLMDIMHLKLDIWFIEKYGDRFDVLFRAGDFIPHGFVVEARKLIQLREEVNNLFYKLVKVARKKNVLLAGITYRIHDNIFLKNVERALGKKLAETTDDNFLSFILDDGDTTTLIYRESEKGRIKVRNWYEFYIKYRSEVYRIDFIAFNDPFEDYEKIRDLAYSASILPPRPGLYPGPSSISISQAKARMKVLNLERTISAVLGNAITTHIEDLQKRRNEEREKDAFGE
ncbi:MAG: hypothetical protein ACP6IP_04265 [Candidatus Njordarchaeia archaeon]